MFGAKDSIEGGDQVSALLERGCEFDGKLTFKGTVRINGHFMGEIFSEGTLIVGEDALVDARVDVGNIIINGKLNGHIEAKELIEMKRPAEVRGDIQAKTLVIEEGVLFEGNCRMGGEGIAIHSEDRLHAISAAQVGAETEEELSEASSILA